MRRSRLDVRLGRSLAIGQRWRFRADATVWTVRQVHRADCRVVLAQGAARWSIPFEQLRMEFTCILDREIAA